jgi:hypothetical protein
MLSPLQLPLAVVRAIDSALRRVEQEGRRIRLERRFRKRIQGLLEFVRFPRGMIQASLADGEPRTEA